MKITDIQIDHFGSWQDLSLQLPNPGLCVFYGPNEAGKTTLMKFIRGVLFGFKTDEGSSNWTQRGPLYWEGRLVGDFRSQECEIGRVAQEQCPRTSQTDSENDKLLKELLSGINEKLFENVYAVGLQDLQELATLDDEDIASHIYGLTLGPQGRRLLEITAEIEKERQQRFDPRTETGQLLEVIQRYDRLNSEIEPLHGCRQRHTDLIRVRNTLQKDIEEHKGRQSGLQSQLCGHLFLERVWTPWNRLRQHQTELNELPVLNGFPENAVLQMEELEAELSECNKCRGVLQAEATELQRQAEQLVIDPEIQLHAVTIQSLIDESDSIKELHQQIARNKSKTDEQWRTFEECLEDLAGEWTPQRLQAVDTSPVAHFQLIDAARKYQITLARRSRLKRKYQRLLQRCQQRQTDLNDQLQQLGEVTIVTAIKREQQRLVDLEESGRLRLLESELEQRQIGIREQFDRPNARLAFPKWFQAVLCLFAITGMASIIGGIATGVALNWIAGLLFVLIGTTSGGAAWAFNAQLTREAQNDIDQFEQLARDVDSRLSETRDALALLYADEGSLGEVDDLQESNPDSGPAEARLIRQTTHRLADLERLAREYERVHLSRRRLSDHRSRYQELQREVSAARQEWCELLTRCGFSETVRIDEAFDTWRRVVQTAEQHRLWERTDQQHQSLQQKVQSYRRRVEELGRRMNRWDKPYEQPLDIVSGWAGELRELSERRKECQRLQREQQVRSDETARIDSMIGDLKTRRSALLIQAGAATREAFQERAACHKRQCQLKTIVAETQAELRSTAALEPDLVVVEEDLLTYNAEENAECITTINSELVDLERDLQQAFEKLGDTKQQIMAMENDRRSTELRLKREQTLGELRHEVEKWCALELAAHSVKRIRTNFERTCQPAVLASAGSYLERLSCGKYKKLWTPLGKRHLLIDDDHDKRFRVEQLSGGTREQLFLAIRLAMVDEFARKGIELPMVLDDVIVNFDQVRTEAAVNELINFAKKGHQILYFTCHLHLAHLFKRKGINPIWLPGHNPPVEERRAG